jgi:mono/diheme cytochrome c family protein
MHPKEVLMFVWSKQRSVSAAIATLALATIACATDDRPTGPGVERTGAAPLAAGTPFDPATLASGREIFRFDTFGDETWWTDTLRMHEVIASSVSPTTALQVGLKVDVDALPEAVRQGIVSGAVDLGSPATTVTLLKLNAVLGVKGQVQTVDGRDVLTRVGITCALCHSTVDNSFSAGIGHRLDGWPNRDLDVGRIVALSPSPLIAPLRPTLLSWGPGMYDPRINVDGINSPVVIPPAFGLRHVALETYTGDGPVSYWNAYVAITQMHGHGFFSDTRIGLTVSNPPDLVSAKLEPLRAYQLSLEAPEAPPTDATAAQRGKQVFNSVAGCARCHQGSTYTDVNSGVLYAPAAVGQDPTYALRTATKLYRTTPLRGLWNPPQLDGPYFHDGSATTLEQVVDHYVTHFGLTLTAQQKLDLVAFLKTL